MSEITIEDKKVKTPKFRVSYPNVFKAKAMNEDDEAKYSVTMLFDKDQDLSDFEDAIAAAAKEKWGNKLPKKFKSPIRDGDEESDDENYEDKYFIRASSKKKPQIIDLDHEPVVDEEGFYPGCYARATIIAFAYEVNGNKGVSFALQNIQKLDDGEAFSGKRSAEDDFADDYREKKKGKKSSSKKSSKKSRDDDDDEDDDLGF